MIKLEMAEMKRKMMSSYTESVNESYCNRISKLALDNCTSLAHLMAYTAQVPL